MRTIVRKSNILFLVSIGILAVTAVFFVARHTYATQVYYPQNYNQNAQTVTTQPSQDDDAKRKVLRSLLQEHAAVAAEVTINRYDNRPEFQASQQLAVQNGQLLAQEVGKLYGSDVQNTFQTLWNRHLDLFVKYTDALKAQDQNAKEQAVSRLQSVSEQLATLLSQNNSLSKSELNDMFNQHVALEQAVIDAHAAGDYTTQYAKMHEGFDHAGMMADTIFKSMNP